MRVFFFLSTHGDLRDVSTGLLSRVKLLCVPFKCQPEVRWSGPTQASSHAPVTDSPSLSSSPQVMLCLAPSVGKIGVKPKRSVGVYQRPRASAPVSKLSNRLANWNRDGEAQSCRVMRACGEMFSISLVGRAWFSRNCLPPCSCRRALILVTTSRTICQKVPCRQTRQPSSFFNTACEKKLQ